uniref:ADP-ribosylglycohydrolase family protein n=1 Tax=Trichobilharzia regenti TaxID=157069 RepID=A0AA85IV72_TRIRE|nr:unnamed protein product [Trichobilharzia regenti]
MTPAYPTKDTTLNNKLGGIIYKSLKNIHHQFEYESLENEQLHIKSKYGLLLDKHYLPKGDNPFINLTKAWCTVAGCTAAYTYKTIGQDFSEPMKIWLANAANCTILFSLLAEFTDVQQSTHQQNKKILPSSALSSSSLPDGNWSYGSWSLDNLLSVNEMKAIIKPEMSDICVAVMIAGVINYYQEGCLLPKTLTKYADDLIKSTEMDQYGITHIRDKLQIMAITSSWISKINIFNEMQKIDANRKSNLRNIKTLGLTSITLTSDMIESLRTAPAGWKCTSIAFNIASKLVQSSECFYFMAGLNELVELVKLWQKLKQNPILYHIAGKVLTNTQENIFVDNGRNLLGRLITYLKYTEPQSELFTSKYLKSNDQTLERIYADYSENWENIVKAFHHCTDKIIKHSSNLTQQLKALHLIPETFKLNENAIRMCREMFRDNA